MRWILQAHAPWLVPSITLSAAGWHYNFVALSALGVVVLVVGMVVPIKLRAWRVAAERR